MTNTETTYITGYGDNPPRWASPTTHAVKAGTSKRHRGMIGMSGVSACGRIVRHGSKAQAFDTTSDRACKTCTRIVKTNTEETA